MRSKEETLAALSRETGIDQSELEQRLTELGKALSDTFASLWEYILDLDEQRSLPDIETLMQDPVTVKILAAVKAMKQ